MAVEFRTLHKSCPNPKTRVFPCQELGPCDDDGVVAGAVARLRDRDVDEVPTQVKVNCNSLANGDDVFIEPPYRGPQGYGRGQRNCLDYRLSGVLESGIYEAGIERDRRLRRRPKVQEAEPGNWTFTGLVIVDHVLAVGRCREDGPLFFTVRLPVGIELVLASSHEASPPITVNRPLFGRTRRIFQNSSPPSR